ncbi:MAG: deoxynucleoside kinase [Bacteroidota bacterium]|nr:deoxynucleoside kinase [Bacteroidota bacterium]
MYSYVAISGTIGAGKTELSKIIAEKFEGKLILEEFAKNSFLEKFYKNPDRYAFPLEISFLFERFQQQKIELSKGDLFNKIFVSDYIFVKSLLFARNNLDSEQYKAFYNLYKAFEEQLLKPDLIIYLHRPVEVLKENIIIRGRSFEQNISLEYLDDIQKLYLQYFKTLLNSKVVILELKNKDFIKDEKILTKIIDLMHQNFKFGMNIIEV